MYMVQIISEEAGDTQKMLNELEEQGFKLICSYGKNGYWLIFHKK